MKLARICIIVLFAVLSLCNAADAAQLGVGGRVSGGAFDGSLFPNVGILMPCNVPMCEDSKSEFVTAPQESVDLAIDGEASWGGAGATAHVAAHARPGDLGINIVAGAAAPDGAYAEFSVSANAGWSDEVTVNAGTVLFANTVIVHSFLSLDGELGGSASDVAGVGAFLLLNDLSSFPSLPPAPYEGDRWGDFSENPSSGNSDEIPGAIKLRNVFRNGVGSTLGYEMIISGGGRSDTTTPNAGINLQAAKAGSAILVANVSGSLHWGGIEMVTDEFGNPIDDWTITSASGFDYSRPFGVPEPSSILLLSFALCLWLGRVRTRGCRS